MWISLFGLCMWKLCLMELKKINCQRIWGQNFWAMSTHNCLIKKYLALRFYKSMYWIVIFPRSHKNLSLKLGSKNYGFGKKIIMNCHWIEKEGILMAIKVG